MPDAGCRQAARSQRPAGLSVWPLLGRQQQEPRAVTVSGTIRIKDNNQEPSASGQGPLFSSLWEGSSLGRAMSSCV